jgi:exodeoxyribonuclease-5
MVEKTFDNKVYDCKVCDVKFSTIYDLKRHFKSTSHLSHFNEEQKNLINEIFNLQEGKIKSIRCNSAGGCGKTYTIANNTIDKEMLYITPSNTACKVLRQLGLKNIMTFAKFFNWKIEYDEEGNSYSLYGAPNISNNIKTIVIDEISMLNNQCFSLFKHYIKDRIPFILLGDMYQLLPVDDDMTELPENVEIVPKSSSNLSLFFECDVDVDVELKENMRAANNELKTLIDYTREKTKNNEPINIKPNITISEEVIRDIYKKYNDFMFLQYTNDVCNQLNLMIRNIIYPEYNEWNIGEQIIINKTFKAKLLQKVLFDTQYLYTSERYKITHIKPIIKQFMDVDIKVFQIVLNDTFIINKVANESKAVFHKKVLEKKKIIKTEKDVNIRKKLFKDFFENEKLDYDCNISYCYAITVHKSQGSSFGNTFIIQNDFNCVRDNFEKNRLFYTAISRSRYNTFLASNNVLGKKPNRKML